MTFYLRVCTEHITLISSRGDTTTHPKKRAFETRALTRPVEWRRRLRRQQPDTEKITRCQVEMVGDACVDNTCVFLCVSAVCVCVCVTRSRGSTLRRNRCAPYCGACAWTDGGPGAAFVCLAFKSTRSHSVVLVPHDNLPLPD